MQNRIRVISHLLVFIWCIVIFLFSSENGTASASRSAGVTKSVINVYETVTQKEVPKTKKVLDQWNYVIRKIAHFSIFFVLGIFVFISFCQYDLPISKVVFYSLLFCISYALFDEFHQLFSSGRSGRLKDVFIDSSGSACSLLISFLVHRFFSS